MIARPSSIAFLRRIAYEIRRIRAFAGAKNEQLRRFQVQLWLSIVVALTWIAGLQHPLRVFALGLSPNLPVPMFGINTIPISEEQMAKHTEDFLRQIEGDLEKEFAQDFFREVRAVFQNYEDKVAGVYRDTVTQFSTNEVEVEDLVNRFSNWSKDQRIHYLGVIDRMIHSALVRTHERHLTHLGISADPADDASDSE